MKCFLTYFIPCLLMVQLIACTKQANHPAADPLTAQSIAGNYKVGSFTGSQGNASAFNSYVFTFNEDGTLTAVTGSSTSTGSWMFDDNNNTEIKIHFPAAPLSQLNKSWHISELTNAHLLLTGDDDINDDAGDDHPSVNSNLEFIRN